ncbi:DUF742 domain-containing protein [Streptomyces chromofuscus]|uniref:DUF742 domain-containing protein n=1 Tax=Streptomyces chromofuscus TaxID=42881 RepID=A0A7M2TAF2_STRCW|nr:DUF742 domain-containing protein [Streptomyces chromofuscus]QOV45707.1 DUF742 domain-containing protein [Streptomyces chromofuscus]GGT17254.1 hypothetical protein GCM10010254_42190 [Streptomyces chromofuscus]
MTPPQRKRRSARPEPPPQPQPQPVPREAGAGHESTDGKDGKPSNPERLFVIGEADGDRADLDLVTLIVARAEPKPSTSPEQAAVLRLCAAPLSVAELSAYLSLPFSVITVLLTEMLTAELVQARAPVVRQALPDRSILEAVMHGLQKL